MILPLSSPPTFNGTILYPPCDICEARGAFVGSQRARSGIGASCDLKKASIKDITLVTCSTYIEDVELVVTFEIYSCKILKEVSTPSNNAPSVSFF